MRTRNLIKSLGGALLAAVLAFGSSANADPVTQLIHFDDANNGWKWYSDVDNNFLFDPTNLQSGNCADDTDPPGNGSCLIETSQGEVTVMTRPLVGPTSQGGGDDDPTGASGEQDFTLLGFYFELSGMGNDTGNFIRATGSGGEVATFQLGQTYANVTNYSGGGPAGPLVKSTGYVATFDDLFEDVSRITFTSWTSANMRLDCVVARFEGTTTQPYDPSTACGIGVPPPPPPPPNNVPEPGTLALLGLGLVGVGLTRRRRRV